MNPLNKLFKYSESVSFEVSGDTSLAVDRLSRSANKPVLQATFSSESSSLVGSVSKEHVRLHKVAPFFGNIVKPMFVGRFQSQNGRNTLVGIFEMGPIGKVVISIFVLFTLAIQVLLLPGLLIGSDIGLFGPALFLCVAIFLVLIFKAYSKQDVAWIKHEVESALKT